VADYETLIVIINCLCNSLMEKQ